MRIAKAMALILLPGLFALVVTGCWTIDLKDFLTPEGKPSNKEIAKAYYLTDLRKSTAADVLPLIHMPEYSLLSQSASSLAVHGESENGYKRWSTIVSFDENDLLAKRKYLMISNEKPKVFPTQPWAGMQFDCELVLQGDVVEEPYADENTRRLAMMKFAREMLHRDIAEVINDNKAYEISGAMINQSLEAVINDLEASPALAVRLSDEEGLEFEHISFDRGKIRMTSNEKTMSIKMRVGSFTQKWDDKEYDYSE